MVIIMKASMKMENDMATESTNLRYYSTPFFFYFYSRAAPSTSDSMIRTRSTAAARFITPTVPSSRASTLMTIEMEKELTLIPTEILSRVTGR